MGEVPVTGTVEGKAMKLTLVAQTPQGNMTVMMTGEHRRRLDRQRQGRDRGLDKWNGPPSAPGSRRTPLRIADWGLRIAIAMVVAVCAVAAQTPTTIKLATLVPTNSIWTRT